MHGQRFTALLALVLPAYCAPSIPGFALTWADDFDGANNALPSSSNWIVDTGTSYPGGPANWGTGEIQTYTNRPANVKLTGNGMLQITPIKDAAGRWTSGRVETQRTNFMAQRGRKMRIQSRILLPNVSGQQAVGYWAAFWTLGANYRGNYQNWPGVGELDVAENVNGLNRVYGVMHCGVNPGGPCNESNGLGNSRPCPNTACQGNWHVYTLEVDRTVSPEVARWYVDGQLYHTITQNTIGATTWAQTVQKGHFVLLNVAIGGGFPNGLYGSSTPLASTVSGRPMYVDYVAVYNS